ncbi:hypothetical protein [Candidatus Neptunochlamydia vexilliferae]|uniref:Uncharacterized protein n=1 Tax=Candidatus Neptunichlamydia vexilliferae TaxID=1651774 RepID=A0ABS0B146_9BACT|nr:hypothetical protein [Candidatus Neptunochlamydia vexilliferae]MBF5060091.1 hypothetical protein [Candidatus Neptunochlamydia vexilliferae]
MQTAKRVYALQTKLYVGLGMFSTLGFAREIYLINMDSEKTPKKDQDSNHNMKPEKVFGYLLFIASACGIIWALGAGISLISQKKDF